MPRRCPLRTLRLWLQLGQADLRTKRVKSTQKNALANRSAHERNAIDIYDFIQMRPCRLHSL